MSRACLTISFGIASRSGMNPFFSSKGILYGLASANKVPILYTGYAGSGTSAISPEFKKASGAWASPSFEPINASTCVTGSRSIPK